MPEDPANEASPEEIEAAREVLEQVKVYWLLRGVAGLLFVAALAYGAYLAAGSGGLAGAVLLVVVGVAIGAWRLLRY